MVDIVEILFFLSMLLCVCVTSIWAVEFDYSRVPDSGNYTCDELIRWLGTEKHYSNDRNKNTLFSLLSGSQCKSKPVAFFNSAFYGHSTSGRRSFYSSIKGKSCSIQDKYAVAYLSNFSINRNFSHFLHGLLRLFCALLDARWLVWDRSQRRFQMQVNYTIWLDENFKLNEQKMVWLKSFSGIIRPLGEILPQGTCISADHLLYGSGCVKLLSPEKWFGYPGCRAGEVLPAFGYYMRQMHGAKQYDHLSYIDGRGDEKKGIRIAFAVRDVGDLTGRREISNLAHVQSILRKSQHMKTVTENITFEHLDVSSTIRYMASVHVFVSVHGAGMTNMFFMNSGSAVIEIIPHPLCSCRSPDYFYGEGGYYHGSSVAQGIAHYSYCVPSESTKWHKKPSSEMTRSGSKCSWKYLHAVESVSLDTSRFVSLMRKVERDLVARGTVKLTLPIINMSPHVNG